MHATTSSPVLGLDSVRWLGHGLVRPECVLSRPNGTLYTADWRGGVCEIRPDGTQKLRLPEGSQPPGLKPNGIAQGPGGGWLLTHLGASEGGVWLLNPAATGCM